MLLGWYFGIVTLPDGAARLCYCLTKAGLKRNILGILIEKYWLNEYLFDVLS